MKLQKSFIAILALFVFAVTADAQFGDLINKVKKQTDKATKQVNTPTNVNPNDGNNSVNSDDQADDAARWDLFKCNPKYVGAVDENTLREIVQYNVNDAGKGGVIVFTKQPLTKKNPTIADTVWTFKAGEPIYMNLVFPEAKEIDDYGANLSTGGDVITTVGDYQKECRDSRFKNNLYVDYGSFEKSLPQVFALDFQPKGGVSAKYQQQIKGIAESLMKLKPGVHLVPVRIHSNGGDIAAVGAFYYDNRDGNGNNEAIEAGLKAITMPKSASPKYAALEKQMTTQGGASALRTVVTDTDWTPIRHEVTGVLIGRAITAVMAIKNKDGGCYRETQTWTQDYDGRNYANLRLTGTRNPTDMACENAVK